MSKSKVNIGIIGAGCISDLHCSAIKETGRGDLYGVYDTGRRASEKLKNQFPELIIYNSLEGGAKGILILEHNNIISNTPYGGNHYYRFNSRTLSLNERGLIEYIDNQKEVTKKKYINKSTYK